MNALDYQQKQQQAHLKCFLKVCEPAFLPLYEKHRSNTMCSPEVLYNAWQAIEYLESNHIEGDILELGTWRGGVRSCYG